MIHRQPTHKDNGSIRKVVEHMKLHVDEVEEAPDPTADTQLALPIPPPVPTPRPSHRRTEHPTHVIPRPDSSS